MPLHKWCHNAEILIDTGYAFFDNANNTLVIDGGTIIKLLQTQNTKLPFYSTFTLKYIRKEGVNKCQKIINLKIFNLEQETVSYRKYYFTL
jgi:hypothetical protein